MTVDKLGNLLPKVLARQPGRGRVTELRAKLAFVQVLGAELAAFCESIEVKGSTLTVTTGNPALAHQLRLDSEQLLRSLNGRLLGRELKALRIRTGRAPSARRI
jgi:Dna[CI] antecedent, DciA